MKEVSDELEDVHFKFTGDYYYKVTIIGFELLVDSTYKMSHEKLTKHKIKNLAFERVIGQGRFSQIYKTVNTINKQNVAVKVISKRSLKRQKHLKDFFIRQINALKKCKSDYIIKFIDGFETDQSVCVATQYCSEGNLEEYIYGLKQAKLEEEQATTYLKHILSAYRQLRNQKIIHRCIEPKNLLLHQKKCKLADFGYSKQYTTRQQSNICRTKLGHLLTMAPQIIQNSEYQGSKVDIWSIGIIYYFMLFGRYPFTGSSKQQILQKIEKEKIDFSLAEITKDARQFIEDCLVANPDLRIGWNEIQEHPLVKAKEFQIISNVYSRQEIQEQIEGNQHLKTEESRPEESNEDLLKYSQSQQLPKLIERQEQRIRRQKQVQKKKIYQSELIKSFQSVNLAALGSNCQMSKKQKALLMIKQKIQNSQGPKIIQKYKQKYQTQIQNLIFAPKQIIPSISAISERIKGSNHSLIMFILNKNTYLNLQDFTIKLTKKQNIFGLTKFNSLTNSPYYTRLIEDVTKWRQKISSQFEEYGDMIDSCSLDIEREMKCVENLYMGLYKWQKCLDQNIDDYIYQLTEATIQNQEIKLTPNQQQMVKRLIQSLYYYKNHKESPSIQQFSNHYYLSQNEPHLSSILNKIQLFYKQNVHDEEQ